VLRKFVLLRINTQECVIQQQETVGEDRNDKKTQHSNAAPIVFLTKQVWCCAKFLDLRSRSSWFEAWPGYRLP